METNAELSVAPRVEPVATPAKPKDSNERYNHLITAAKFCFEGTVTEAWAKADHCVRTKFRGSQRLKCDEVTAQLNEAEPVPAETAQAEALDPSPDPSEPEPGEGGVQ